MLFQKFGQEFVRQNFCPTKSFVSLNYLPKAKTSSIFVWPIFTDRVLPAILECEDDTSKTVLGQSNDFASDESKLEGAIMKQGSSRNASVLPWWSTCLSMKPDPYGYRFSKSWLLRMDYVVYIKRQ